MCKDIEYYLPHKAPMLLIDSLVDVDEDSCHCQTRVTEDSAVSNFIEGNDLDCTFYIELMAQCIGVWSGYHQRQAGATTIKKGMLVGVRNANFFENKCPSGKLLEIYTNSIMVENNVGSFECKVISDGCLVAEAMITTYQIEDEAVL